MAEQTDGYRVKLITVAAEVAAAQRSGFMRGNEAAFLQRFRAAYRHLAATVEKSDEVYAGTAGASARPTRRWAYSRSRPPATGADFRGHTKKPRPKAGVIRR